MSILARIRPTPRGLGHPALPAEVALAMAEPEPSKPRAPLWPVIVLTSGAVLSAIWVVMLLRMAYIGLLWLFGTG